LSNGACRLEARSPSTRAEGPKFGAAIIEKCFHWPPGNDGESRTRHASRS
jgi:hypothetical protein